MSSGRVNRGAGAPSASSSSLLQAQAQAASSAGAAGNRNARGGASYAGASRAATGGSEWGSPAQGRPAATTSALKPQAAAGAANPTSPNPYAPAFVSAAPSPWSTPSGSSATTNNRYNKTRTGSTSGASGGTAVRTLFPGSSPEEASSKYLGTRKSPHNWEEHASSDGSTGGQANGGADATQPAAGEESAGSLLRGGSAAHPEHWESYDADGSKSAANASTLAAPSTDSSSLNHTPFDSPSLGPSRNPMGSPTGDAEPLQLDTRGTDVSLSVLHKDCGANELSIHMLSLLYDPPVQGCELKPYVSVVDSFGRVSAVHTDEAAQGLDFRWFRGQKRVCSNTLANCSKAATMQCLPCAKLSPRIIPPHLTYFCSDKCLRDNWAQHKQLHAQQQGQPQREWEYDEDVELARPESPSHLHCKYPALMQNSWEESGSARAYVPSAEDVGRALRLECSPILSSKAPRKDVPRDADAVLSTSQHTADLNLGTVVRIDTGAVLPTPHPPPPRTILYADPSTPINSANTFRTVCYNVLAQIYTTRQVYPYTAIWALAWEYRKGLLLRDILSHHADVICLQEVQSNHFETFFQPQLSKHGYDGIFKKKTRDAGSDSVGAQMIDGCATFYKRERFALMEQYGIEFNEAARQHTANRTQLRRLLRGNIALVLVLEELSPPPSSSAAAAARRNRKRRLCITNTHIFWDPEFADVKLWQTWVLCQELEKLVLPRNLPLVLCGDFNSLGDSSVYELLSQQSVEQGEDVFGAAGDPSGLLPAPHAVSHRLPLLSAYAATAGEPKYTNYTGSFVGVLDYVFFTRSHLRCVAVLDVDDEATLRQHTALPSPQYPSDHLALVTTLEFMDA